MREEDTKADSRDLIEKLAVKAFADHKLTFDEKSRSWLCAKPGTAIYHFRVAELPGAVAVWGDLGDMMILGGAYGIEWMCGSIRSEGYFLSKSNLKKDRYYPGELRRRLRESIEDLEAQLKDDDGEVDEYIERKLNEANERYLAASRLDFGYDAYQDYMWNHPDAEIYESVYGYDSGAYWMIEALKVFIKLYEEQKANNSPTQDVAGAVSGGVDGNQTL